jgi:hypothetical protein
MAQDGKGLWVKGTIRSKIQWAFASMAQAEAQGDERPVDRLDNAFASRTTEKRLASH